MGYTDISHEFTIHDEDGYVVLGFEREYYERWCLALVLLKESLVEEVIVRNPGTEGRLVFRVLEDAAAKRAKPKAPTEFGNVARNGNALVFHFCQRELDYCLFFYLRCLRDGVSPVNHVDIELADASGGLPLQLVLKVADVAPPLPGHWSEDFLAD